MAYTSAVEKLLGGNRRASSFIEETDWSQPLPTLLEHIQQTLKAAAISLDEVKEAAAGRRHSINIDDAFILEAASAERPLIYKHCIALGNTANAAKIWVHEYRPESWMTVDNKRHIEHYHNHRVGLGSIILRGGYVADEFRYPGMLPEKTMDSPIYPDWGPKQQGLVPQTVEYTEGSVMCIHPDEIHRLRNIQPNTVTLVVDTPKVRDFAFTYSEDGHQAVQMFPDMGYHYNNLAQRLGI